jgi:Zn-finger protein
MKKIKKNFISFCYCPKYTSSIKKQNKRKEKKNCSKKCLLVSTAENFKEKVDQINL